VTPFEIQRVFDAPRERVFAADAQGVQRLEETITVHLADEGGRTRLTLRATAAGTGAEAAAMLRSAPALAREAAAARR
jgi:hypothetical protein